MSDSTNKIYNIANQVLDAYIKEGVQSQDLANYLNVKENFEFVYNRCYRRLTMDDVMFESDDLKECLRDIVRDRIAFINDTSK